MVAVMGVMAVSSCKLTEGRSGEEFMASFLNEHGDVKLGDAKNADLYTMGGATFESIKVEELEIDWYRDSVTIQAYDGNEVVISETSDSTLTDSTTMHYYLNSKGTLKIVFGKPGVSIKGSEVPNKQLLIKVPRTLRLESVEVNGIDHDFRMDSVRCEDLEINSVSSTMFLNECEIENIEVNGVSTNLSATFSRMPEEIELNNVSGETVLWVPENAGMTLELNGIVNNFHSTLPVANKGKKKIIGNGACKIESNAVAGDLDIIAK
jgi:hypothetical protein